MINFRPGASHAKARVVIVDDHEAIVEMMTTVIESLTVHKVVGFAVDAVAAMEICRRERPDVVILDLVLAESNGVGLLQSLHRACPQTRVLVFSGNLNPAAIRGVLAAGVSGIVEKMSALSELRTALEAVAAGRIYFSPFVCDQIKGLVCRDPVRGKPRTLSKRETMILRHLAQGLTAREIAGQLGISVNTVVTHRYNLMQKIGLRSAAQLSLYAAQAGLIKDAAYAVGA